MNNLENEARNYADLCDNKECCPTSPRYAAFKDGATWVIERLQHAPQMNGKRPSLWEEMVDWLLGESAQEDSSDGER